MLCLTSQERKVLIFIGVVIFAGAALKFFNVSLKKPSLAENKSITSIININTASQSQLQSLTGIGPSLASRIIDYRDANGDFSDLGDLKKVKGIGDKKAQILKPYISFED